MVVIPLVDEWSYPRHDRGVTEIPGIYVVGLPWLTHHYFAIFGGVGLDAEYEAGSVSGS
jgi:putative flavoprotein involved in K+ transport